VRFVYLDESGISVNEPVTVVGGVIINADLQYMAVKQRIEELIKEYVPQNYRAGFSFHAKDLFHGSGFFNKHKWPREHSRAALKALIEIPSQFQLPIVCGHLRKRPQSELTKSQRRDEPSKNQAMAFSLCALAAEKYMRQLADTSEVANLIAENNNETRRAVKEMSLILRGLRHGEVEGDIVSLIIEFANGYFPIRRIVDTVYFANKEDAFLLQLADACALMIRYFFEGRSNAEEFLDVLTQGNPSVLGNRDNPAGYGVVTFKPAD
jgi:hypothetical protein